MGVRQRPYWCEVEEKKIDGRYCTGEKVPRHIDVCQEKPCTSWYIGNWSECTSTCGRGVRSRPVFCQETESALKKGDDHCAHKTKPIAEAECIGGDGAKCVFDDGMTDDEMTNEIDDGSDKSKSRHGRYRWKVGPWQECSRECGRGAQVRAIACFDSKRNARDWQFRCKKSVVKPRGSRMCNVKTCAEGKWIEGAWSTCSVTCGKGIQTRSISCVSSTNGELAKSGLCSGEPPNYEQICLDNPDCDHQVPQSSHVEHNEDEETRIRFQWRKGEWSGVRAFYLLSPKMTAFAKF